MLKRYFSIKEVSEYTSLPTPTLYEWAAQGKIPSIKVHRRVLFDLQDVDFFLQSLKRTPDQIQKAATKIIGKVQGNGL